MSRKNAPRKKIAVCSAHKNSHLGKELGRGKGKYLEDIVA